MGVTKMRNKAMGVTRSSGRGVGSIPDLPPSLLLKNMSDPPDRKRKEDLDKLAARAKAGDAEALERLHVLAALPGYEDQYGKGYGAGTRDGRNWARYLLETQFGEDLNYLTPGDKFSGDELGGALKVLAPLAGAFLPGVGFLGAAAIGAGGTAAGQYAQTGRVDLKDALLKGTLAGAGNSILGNGLGSTSSALPGVPGTTAAATGSAGMGGNAAVPSVSGSAAGVSGVLGAAGRAKGVGDAISKYGPLVLGGLGVLDTAAQHREAERLRREGLEMARRQYELGAPARAAAQERILGPTPVRPDLSTLYQSPNPYARPVPRG
jgi:hypothetical protein